MDIVVGKAYLKSTSEYYAIVRYIGTNLVVFDYYYVRNHIKMGENTRSKSDFEYAYSRPFRITKKKYLYLDMHSTKEHCYFLSGEKIQNLDSWCKYLGEIPDYLGDD